MVHVVQLCSVLTINAWFSWWRKLAFHDTSLSKEVHLYHKYYKYHKYVNTIKRLKYAHMYNTYVSTYIQTCMHVRISMDPSVKNWSAYIHKSM